MSQTISREIKLFGTDETVEPMRTMTAGPLTAEFDQGALRFIKVHGIEAVRNIAFVVRDKDWGTYQPEITNLNINQTDNEFVIQFDAVCKDDVQEIHYRAIISGAADGTLSFTGEYQAVTDFLTNRTGFVVLHPVQGVSGCPVSMEKVDGSVIESHFPELVDPVQPFQDLRALTHEVMPGVSVSCRMNGDAFETEDHRQWNDASYKTYVRPLTKPWPYTIAVGESHQGSVVLTLKGSPTKAAAEKVDGSSIVSISPTSDSGKTMPRIGLGLEPQHLQDAQSQRDLLSEIGVQQLVTWHDLSANNGAAELKQANELAQHIGADLVLHAVIPDNDYKKEVATLSSQCADADVSLSAISVAPAEYLKSIMPGKVWPDVTALDELYDEVRRTFPGVTLGGGMLSFFPELNRHRPPTAHLDFITHASNTITHACDDITVTENLEAIPYVIKTCRSFADGKPYHVGPSSIGMRFNPYGSKTMDNPDNKRIAMARMEPRQRGLINAAWTVGYVAHMARGGIDAVNLHAPTGEFGLIYQPQDWQQPGFDNTDRIVYPAYPVVAGLAAAAGKVYLPAVSSSSREVECVGYQDGNSQIVWVANLTGESRTVTISGLQAKAGEMAALTEHTFDTCTQSTSGFNNTSSRTIFDDISLEPYAVVKLAC